MVLALHAVDATAGVATKPVLTPGKVTAVTVYQGQALVTRLIVFEAGDQPMEVVVGELPQQINASSLYAEPANTGGIDGLEIRSVRYRVRPVAQDTREEVRELDRQIEQVRDEANANTKRTQLLQSRTAYLNKLEGFTTTTADRELQNGVLNAGTLKDLTSLVFDERAQIAEQELELAIARRELDRKLAKLNAERNTLTRGSSKTHREAVVFIDPKQAGRHAVRLTYLVAGATWNPSYNLRADANRTNIVVEYNASVQQLSGEDWTDVEMTLSTASPSLVATAPTLEPLAIRLAALAPPAASKPAAKQAYDKARRELFAQQRELSDLRNYAMPNAPGVAFDEPNVARGRGTRIQQSGHGGFGGAVGQFGQSLKSKDKGLNELADRVQLLDFNARGYDYTKPESSMNGSEGISVVYRLEGRTSLPSRSDKQQIKIAALPMAGEFYRVARPVLTSFVYEEAKVTNDSDMVLLAGPAATFVADRFVGRGETPTVAVGESFVIGLGIDESLRVDRKLVQRKERVQGGNRVVRFDYQMTLKNFGAEEANVRLFDRMPVSANKESDEPIKVSLLSAKPEPMTPETDEKDGMLEWLVTAPARGEKVGKATIDYAVQIEYDKNRSIDLAANKN